MKFLVTAGNTQMPIDRVRCITNIFSGRTGAQIAQEAHTRGHSVVLLTSHPEAIDSQNVNGGLELFTYRTFDELERLMEREITLREFDAVVHCAAVSDFISGGVFAPAPGTRFDENHRRWVGHDGARLVKRDRGKIKSSEGELWLRLIPAPKLVDQIRSEWAFKGLLVKFKLEVNVSEKELLQIAEQSRVQSQADLMVANTLDGMNSWALLGPIEGRYQTVIRRQLSKRLISMIEKGR